MLPRLLSAVALAIFSLARLAVAQQPVTHTKDSLETVKENLKEGKAILVDVRELSEWDAGHLKGAVLVPQSKLKVESQLGELLKSLPKERLYSATSESLNWVAVGGAMQHSDLKAEVVDYVPVYRTPAGTGGGWTFIRWQ